MKHYKKYQVVVRVPTYGTEVFYEKELCEQLAEFKAKIKAKSIFGIHCEVIAVVPM